LKTVIVNEERLCSFTALVFLVHPLKREFLAKYIIIAKFFWRATGAISFKNNRGYRLFIACFA
jgi:hypothetical protein